MFLHLFVPQSPGATPISSLQRVMRALSILQKKQGDFMLQLTLGNIINTLQVVSIIEHYANAYIRIHTREHSHIYKEKERERDKTDSQTDSQTSRQAETDRYTPTHSQTNRNIQCS